MNFYLDAMYQMVLEYADGGTLEVYLVNRKLDWNDKLHLALQLSEPVLCLHKLGIIHCDLVLLISILNWLFLR